MTRIAGHDLPSSLARVLLSGAWPADVPPEILQQIFGEAPDRSGKLYAADEMVGESLSWQVEDHRAYLGAGTETLDPSASLLIGDLGFDRPFGLDLRTSPPCVRFLTIDGRWVIVARSVDELLQELGIG